VQQALAALNLECQRSLPLRVDDISSQSSSLTLTLLDLRVES